MHADRPSVRDRGPEPMCLDEVWLRRAYAWMHKKPFHAERVGVAYMLAGDAAGASNIDPHATTPTADNQWVIEGPLVMIIVPDAAQLDSPCGRHRRPQAWNRVQLQQWQWARKAGGPTSGEAVRRRAALDDQPLIPIVCV